MEQKQTTEELIALDAQCGHLTLSLGADIRNVDIMAKTVTARELSMVRTKIDEAIMWLEKYHAGVNIELARRTCR